MMTDNLESLFKNKNEFVNRLTKDEELAKCLLCNDRDFKSYNLNEEEMDYLVWDRIFPCKYNIDTVVEGKSYITMHFKYTPSKESNVWKVGYITFYVLCHKDLIRTDHGLRYDFIIHRICSLLNNTRNETWLGKLKFDGMEDISYDSYIGSTIRFKNTEQM